MLNAKGGADPASWTRLNAYVLDENNKGEKVAWARVSNCGTDDPGWAVKRIIATQSRNTRARADKSYHLVISFPPGEMPTREQVEDIEDRLCEAIGFGDHQRVSATHQNTDNWHHHVAINRIHPETLHAVHPFRDHYRLQEACAELEIKHGLVIERHSRDAHEAARNRQEPERGHEAEQPTGLGQQAVVQDPPSGIAAQKAERSHSAAVGQSKMPQAPKARADAGPDLNYEAFRRKRAAAYRERTKAMKALRAQQADYARRLSAWHSERLRQEGLTGNRGHLRRDGFAHLADQRRQDRAERLGREAQERQTLMASFEIPVWRGGDEPRQTVQVGRGGREQSRGKQEQEKER